MGSRGYNAGGFAYMDRKTCKCGRKYVIGKSATYDRGLCHIYVELVAMALRNVCKLNQIKDRYF